MSASFAVLIFSLVFLGFGFYMKHLETVPKKGGDYTEALVGSPKYINPLYASINDTDNDITHLVFSSLLKYDGNGNLINDLARSYEISPDGKTYTFKIRTDAKWDNGTNITADDIVFTVGAIKDPAYKSPLLNSFSGVDAEKIDDETVKFTLSEPYAPFLDLMTFGILPQSVWSQIPAGSASLADLNLKPIGSGPYEFKSLTKDKNGQIKTYTLAANKDYYDGEPNITNLTFKIFGSYDEALQAFNEKTVDGISRLPEGMKDKVAAKNAVSVHKLISPQLNLIFLNSKNNQALADLNVRQALAFAIDRNEIVNQVFGGDARIANGPILPDNFSYCQDARVYNFDKAKAEQLLDNAGWSIVEITDGDINKIKQAQKNNSKVDEYDDEKLALGPGAWRFKNGFLVVKLTAVDSVDRQIIEKIKNDWEGVGVKTVIDTVPAAQIQSEVIQPREFEALLYGQIVGQDPDLYAFWDSSQIGSGANISGYANKDVDRLLETGRATIDINARKEDYCKFQKDITNDEPAIFLYSPDYIYAQSKKVKGVSVNKIETPADRFTDIGDWYVNTGKKIVW